MAQEKNLYLDYWCSYLDDFIDILKSGGYKGASIEEKALKDCGDRCDYTFLLEMEDGLVVNNTDGSAVARDLYIALSGDARFRFFAKGKRIIKKVKVKCKVATFVLCGVRFLVCCESA